MILLLKQVMFRFHVNFPGCNGFVFNLPPQPGCNHHHQDNGTFLGSGILINLYLLLESWVGGRSKVYHHPKGTIIS